MSKHFLSVLWLVLLWWTAYALMFATQVVSMGEQQGNPTSWNEALRYSFGGWMTWVPLSMALYWLVFHFPIERGRVMRAIPVLLAGVALVVVLRAIYVYLTNPLFGWYPSLPPFTDVLWTSLRNNLMMAMTVVGVSHALVFYRQAREREHKVAELESHLARTRLDMLRAQLNPHFLFNALNSVAEMVHQDADMADRMLVSLSALLRDSLSAEQMQLRPLRNELAVVNHYLTIEKIRLGDRLQIEWNIDDRCLDVATPMLILQPLVENAIVHAIARQRTPSTLRLCGRLDDGMLVLDVENTLVVDDLTTSGTGIGLRSIRDRLQLLYAERAQLLVRDAGPGVFAVELRIPKRSNSLHDVPLARSSVRP